MRKLKKDGRLVLTGKDYTEFRCSVYKEQDGHCKRCGRSTCLKAHLMMDHSFHVHHRNGRGLGGGNRDDTLESVDGLCGACHRKEHGQ